jgi:cation diffusion facilitator CzcD-associated flavoprotein CzcO
MSGLCMGIKLKQAGIDSFTIYEKAADVGGTWRENTYPGLVCDVPSRYYSYSFEPNPDWTRLMSPGGEIHAYFARVADKYGLREHIRFGTEIESARHDGARWHIRARGGEREAEPVEADFLISCCGVLHHPRVPQLKGLETFEGAAFHSARWDHDVDLRGKRVAVIGTGSTGVQLVCGLADVAARVSLFQRTAQWVYPTPNLRYRGLGRGLMRRFPALSRLSYRFWQRYVELSLGRAVVQPGWQRVAMGLACRLHLRTVRNRELRRKLTPTYDPMCKRIVVSGSFYRAVQRPHVDVVTAAIDHVEPRGIRTTDGTLHELDVLVLATGFDAHAYLRPIELENSEGLTLEEAWRERVSAYRTVALAGFPNFFMLMGPHSPFGNQSLVMIAENQADYVMHWIDRFRNGEIVSVAPTHEATERFNDELRAAMGDTVWMTGCNSWYLGKDGYPELWPWVPERHREMLAEPRPEELLLRQ